MSEALETALKAIGPSLGKSCPFMIGQRVHLHDNIFEMEVVGIRREWTTGLYEVEVVIAEMMGSGSWKFLPDVLHFAHPVETFKVIMGGKNA